MTTTEKPIAEFKKLRPCVNGCTKTDLDGVEHNLAARIENDQYCDRCYRWTDKQLRDAAELVEHILRQVAGIPSRVKDESKRTKKNPPLPFNVDAFNSANELYARLVYWCAVWATRLNRQPPAPAARAWRTDSNRIVGLPNDIAPSAARYAVGIMALWLSAHLDDIMRTPWVDDINYFRTEIGEDISTMQAKWPRKDKRQYAPVRCPDDDCQGKIVIDPPRFEQDDQRIQCEQCGRIFMPDDYDRMASVFRQARKDQQRAQIQAAKVKTRLTKKWTA